MLFWAAGVLIVAAAFASTALALVTSVPLGIAVAVVMALGVLAAYLRMYVIAWNSIPISNLVDIDGTPATAAIGPDPAAPNTVGGQAERNCRAFMIGVNAALTTAIVFAMSGGNPLAVGIGVWDFVVVSLSAVPAMSSSRVFQGVLGWTGWMSPTSLGMSVFGFWAFLWNLPFAMANAAAFPGISPVRIDWATGAVETAGGGFLLLSAPPPGLVGGGFTVGHFTFMLAPMTPPTNPATLQTPFTPLVPAAFNPSAHEVGHCLDNVAFGGIRNVIAIFDQIVLSNAATAYTELTADSHVPHIGRFQVDMWS